MITYEAWLYQLKHFLVYSNFINKDVTLCPKSWRHYYDRGMKIGEAVKEDFDLIKFKNDLHSTPQRDRHGRE